MFEGSHLPLNKWFYTIYVFTSHKKGTSSIQLTNDIGVTQKTAWLISERIRHNMKDKMQVEFGNLAQIDETYISGRNKSRVKHNRSRSLKTKIPVVGLVRNGMVRTFAGSNNKTLIIKSLVRTLTEKDSSIVTDGYYSYKGLCQNYDHRVEDHGSGEYVRDSFHTNTIGGFWSHLKRGIEGVYHWDSKNISGTIIGNMIFDTTHARLMT